MHVPIRDGVACLCLLCDIGNCCFSGLISMWVWLIHAHRPGRVVFRLPDIGESGIGANGENTPGVRACTGYCPQPWSYHVSFCGDIDLVGFRKPQSHYRAVLWNVSQLELAVHAPVAPHEREAVAKWGWPDERQSWTWPSATAETAVLSVNVYSQYEEVMLLVNGRPMEAQPRVVSQSQQFTATYAVPYQPGNITAVGYQGGKAVAATSLLTAGAPTKLLLIADRMEAPASRDALFYVTAIVADTEGRRVPYADNSVTFVVTGTQWTRRYTGRCVCARIRPSGTQGKKGRGWWWTDRVIAICYCL